MNGRLFLLSPASTTGKRAAQLLSPNAQFDLAVTLRTDGVTLGDAFAFLSGLYFRGKLAYARAFAGVRDSIHVLTSGRGLLSPDTIITADDLRGFAGGNIDLSDHRYVSALRADAERLAAADPAVVILLGSIASGKYVDVLLPLFGERLVFPSEFVGRGDMSRGGLMLRSVREGRELSYIPILGAARRGARPPKLEPIAR